MKVFDTLRLDALSTLTQWNGNNAEMLRKYFADHQWLSADIKKLRDYAKLHSLAKVAITDTLVYGIEKRGMVCIVSRADLGIGDNFS